tara:strand:+ start:1134 stop:2099 length:966 start_codon:yes stop_codon:yes gene_type:complete
MKPMEILLFGGSGQIGRHLIRKLTKNNFKVTVVTRNYHQKAIVLKTQANPGYIDIVEANIFDEEKLEFLTNNKDICINLIGILNEDKKNSFKNIHTNFPFMLSKICQKNKVKKFIHISALGIDKAIESKYAKSKLEGEKLIFKNFSEALILRPSLVYSVDDNFTTKFMTLLNLFPIFPLYYSGNTKFAPIHVSDLCSVIYGVLENDLKSEIIECVGPEILSFKMILEKLLNSIDKKRLLVPTPLFLAKITASVLEFFMKNPLLTNDQLKLLKYDNIPSGNLRNNFDLNLKSNSYFDEEIIKYSFMWKETGQFSKKNYSKND